MLSATLAIIVFAYATIRMMLYFSNLFKLRSFLQPVKYTKEEFINLIIHKSSGVVSYKYNILNTKSIRITNTKEKNIFSRYYTQCILHRKKTVKVKEKFEFF